MELPLKTRIIISYRSFDVSYIPIGRTFQLFFSRVLVRQNKLMKSWFFGNKILSESRWIKIPY